MGSAEARGSCLSVEIKATDICAQTLQGAATSQEPGFRGKGFSGASLKGQEMPTLDSASRAWYWLVVLHWPDAPDYNKLFSNQCKETRDT